MDGLKTRALALRWSHELIVQSYRSKFFQIAISSNSTKPTADSKGKSTNAQLTIDDVVFTYTAKTLSSLAITGTTPLRTIYNAGEALNPAGLVVTGTYDDNTSAGDVTSKVDGWTLDPTTLSAGATSCNVMASIGTSLSSPVKTISGLTVVNGSLYTINANNGSFNSSTGYSNTWTSTSTSPTLTLTCVYPDGDSQGGTINNMQTVSGNETFIAYSANSNSSTNTAEYDLTLNSDDYEIVAYSFDYVQADGTTLTVKDNAGNTYTSGTSVAVNGSTAKFTITGATSTINYITISNFKVIVKAKKTLSSIAITGTTPTKTSYEAGEAFDPTGLVVTGTYSDGTTADVTSQVEWDFEPETLSAGTTSVYAVAGIGSLTCDATISGLTVKASTLLTLYNNATTKYYRIPAIAKDKDGNLYAYADFRYGSGNDIGGNSIDIQVRKSTDDGATWSTASNAIAHSSSATSGFDYAHGDAAVVADREGNGFLIMAASGSVGYGSSTASSPIRIGRYTSTDGLSWSGSDVTTAVYGVNSSLTKAFFTSGRICQSRFIKVGDYYRLYSAMCTNLGSLVVYSDDFGATWKQLGSTVPTTTDGDEAKIEELPNGNVLLSSRANSTSVNGRYFNIFTYTSKWDAKGAWLSSPNTSNSSTEGTYTQACSCNGEILIVPAKDASNNACYVALQSIPKGSGRNNLVVYYKVLSSKTDFDTPLDFVSGWTLGKQINSTTSCYSTMVLDKNGDVAFIYEENYDGTNGYDIKFQTLSLSSLTSGAYTYNADLLTEANNNTYLGITTYDDIESKVGQRVTLNCNGYTSSESSTFNEYLYNNNNAIGTQADAPSGTIGQFIVAKGFNGGYTFQSALNKSKYLGVTTGNVALESYPAEFILTKNNSSTNTDFESVDMTGYALQYYYPSDIINDASNEKSDDGVRFIALKNEDAANTDRLNYTCKNYQPDESSNYFSTDFTLEAVKYALTSDSKNVYVYGDNITDDDIAGAYTYLDAEAGTGTKTANSLVYVEDDNDFSSSTYPNNIVVNSDDNGTYTCANFVLTDKVDFYCPIDFTATNLSYSRSNTAGWNSVCLPFAFNSTNVNNGTIETSPVYDSATNTVTFSAATQIDAGTPCFVKCADDDKGWNINLDNATVTGEINETTSSLATMKGSYVKKTIGTGYFKLNTAGTALTNTLETSTCTAFRSYLECNTESMGAKSINVVWGEIDTPTSITKTEVENMSDVDAIYSANGAKINKLQRGVNIVKYSDGKVSKVFVK